MGGPSLRPTLRKLEEHGEVYVAVGAIVLMLGLVFWQVVARYVFGVGVTWAEELSRFGLVWCIFLGASYGIKQGAHIRITAGLLLFPPGVRKWILFTADVVWLLFSIFVSYHAAVLVYEMTQHVTSSPALGWNLAYVYAILPVSFLLMCLRLLQMQVRLWRSAAETDPDAGA